MAREISSESESSVVDWSECIATSMPYSSTPRMLSQPALIAKDGTDDEDSLVEWSPAVVQEQQADLADVNLSLSGSIVMWDTPETKTGQRKRASALLNTSAVSWSTPDDKNGTPVKKRRLGNTAADTVGCQQVLRPSIRRKRLSFGSTDDANLEQLQVHGSSNGDSLGTSNGTCCGLDESDVRVNDSASSSNAVEESFGKYLCYMRVYTVHLAQNSHSLLHMHQIL